MKFFFISKLAGFVLIFKLLLISGSVQAQKDVTKFMGIPVDGDKASMVRALRGKGFALSSSNSSMLIGEFNGKQVNVHIVTNNNKVCRIMVTEVVGVGEGDIKINFNKLYNQFKDNKNYMSALASDGIIPDDEDISYEMLVSKKRYEASFYQKSSTSDSARTARELQEYFLTKYTKDQLDNPSAELVDAMLEDGLSFMADKHSKKSVWFMISERYGKYYINLFYDNEYNRANGDDL
jgi:hypothetical protein